MIKPHSQERLDWSRAEKLVVRGDLQSLFQAELIDFIAAATQPREAPSQTSTEKLESMWIRTKYDIPLDGLTLKEAPLSLQLSDVLHPVLLSPADLGLAPPDPALQPAVSDGDAQREKEEMLSVMQLLTQNRLLPVKVLVASSQWVEEAQKYSAERWTEFFATMPLFRSLEQGTELLSCLLRAVHSPMLGDVALSTLLHSYITQAQDVAAQQSEARKSLVAIPSALKQLMTLLVRHSSMASMSALEVGSSIEKLGLRRCGVLGVKCEMELAAVYFVARTQATPQTQHS